MRLHSTAVLMLALCLSVTAPHAQETAEETKAEQPAFDFPGGREGEVAAAFIASFNSGKEEMVSEFISTYGSKEWQDGEAKELYSYKRMHQLLGTLTPHSIVKSDEADIIVLVRSASIRSYFSVGLSLDDAAPRMLTDHFIRPAAPPKS